MGLARFLPVLFLLFCVGLLYASYPSWRWKDFFAYLFIWLVCGFNLFTSGIFWLYQFADPTTLERHIKGVAAGNFLVGVGLLGWLAWMRYRAKDPSSL